MKSPSEKQIKFADEIASKLNLDFPRGSYDFTAQRYYYFISQHIEEYKKISSKNCTFPFLEDEDDIFWGYDYALWEY